MCEMKINVGTPDHQVKLGIMSGKPAFHFISKYGNCKDLKSYIPPSQFASKEIPCGPPDSYLKQFC